MRHSLEELAKRAEATAAAFENFEPTPGTRDAPMPPIMAVKLAAWRRNTAEVELAAAVEHARAQDISWRALGEAIGTSGEAARQRYSHHA